MAAGKPTPDRGRYYEKIRVHGLAPLWERLRNVLTPEPHTASLPFHWSYAAVRPLLLESANVVSAEEAERRVLVLENPAFDGGNAITESLYAGLQLIMPGETARAHRHTPAALRFIIEGESGYTAVNGVKARMSPGDLILTPAWTWHDHGNEGTQPVTWLDVLDLPLVEKLGPIFMEPGPQAGPPDAPTGFHFPYQAARRSLTEAALHPALGHVSEYPPMPTISMFLHLLPAGFRGRAYRCTEGRVFCVAEGRGRVITDEKTFQWERHDVFVMPCWKRYRLEADEESVLFAASDRGVQSRLGLLREA
jgi:gentisate 1,2-dioxygenase